MKPIVILGVVLILLGIGGLVFRNFHWTETENVANIGPIHINSEEDHNVWIPTAAGVFAVIAGLGLVVVGRRSA